jgi:hypothetical protein
MGLGLYLLETTHVPIFKINSKNKYEFKAMMGHKIHSDIQGSNRTFLAIVHSSLKPQN